MCNQKSRVSYLLEKLGVKDLVQGSNGEITPPTLGCEPANFYSWTRSSKAQSHLVLLLECSKKYTGIVYLSLPELHVSSVELKL